MRADALVRRGVDEARVEALPDLAAEAAAALGADAAIVLRATPAGRLELVAAYSADGVLRCSSRSVSTRARAPLATAFRAHRVVRSEHGFATGRADAAAVAAPLVLNDEPVGVLGLEFTGPDVPDDAAVAEVADAVARLFDRLDRESAHQRAQRLERATALVADVQPKRQIARSVLEEAVAASGAVAGVVVLYDPGRDQYRVVADLGYEREVIGPFDPLPLDLPTPIRDAAVDGRFVAVESRVDYAERYPELREQILRLPDRAVVALPLAAGEAPFGAVGLAFNGPRILDDEERAFLLALARICAQAIDRSERARLYERVRLLQRATAQLARAVTPGDVGRVVINEAAEALGAAAGRVALLAADGTLATLAQAAELDEIVARAEANRDVRRMPLGASIDRNETVLLESLDRVGDEWSTAAEVFSEIGMGAVAATPLQGRDGPIGGIGFVWREPRPLLHEEEEFLRAIAGVCAQALERTRLFEETERSRVRLRTILDRLDEAVVVVGPTLDVAYANRAAGLLFGTSSLVQRPLPAPWPELALHELAEAALTAGAEPYDTTAALADDRALELSTIPDDGQVILVLRDVTRRERQERAEREFVANASHELRTPLAAIAAAVDALQAGAKDSVSDRDFLLDGIADELVRLTQLSEALLLLARAQADPACFLLEAVEIEPLLTEILARTETRAGVRVVTDLQPCIARGDRTLLLAALSNLVQNAVRHTTRGSIDVQCKQEADMVAIMIADTGDGMSADVRARATERFFRGADGRAAEREGFGLGLALALQIVELVDGTISIEPRASGGTRMIVRMPSA